MASIPQSLRGGGRSLPWRRPGPNSSIWVVAAFAVLGASAMLPVVQRSTATSRGYTLQARQAERVEIQSEMRQLEAEVARLTSQDRIARRAGQIGLAPAGDALYITVAEAGPEPAKIPVQYLPTDVPPVPPPSPWWRSLLDWLPLR